MTTPPLFQFDPSTPNANAVGIQLPLDRRVAEQLEQAERRRAARREMQSQESSAAEKIGAWERLHGLRLPRDPNHMVLRLIARRTGLRMEAVLEEQRQRFGRSG